MAHYRDLRRRILPDGNGINKQKQPEPRQNTETSTEILYIHKVQTVSHKALPNPTKVDAIIAVNTLHYRYKLRKLKYYL